MQVSSLFAQSVDRSIEGVIKADDDSSLWNEVEEYVLTDEIARELEGFFEAYATSEGANGVWISGFFGCGKSHLLKMLSLLLADRDVDGRSVASAFADKCGDNILLQAALQKATAIPSNSILFNIDQKVDVIHSKQLDSLLTVFVKVIDESCGYYGRLGYIANFERKLDEDDLLQDFQQAFEGLEPKGWQWGRTRVDRMAAKIDQAYQLATGEAVTAIMDRTKADYKLSIEDFANLVNKYIEKQPVKNFRLNFFVDEVGQYIADNTKLMTNLQTIAESLATRCKGRAWLIVTAQEDINTMLGEMDKQQSHDFSKIKARFTNTIQLSSQNVAEVIQKRLLRKNSEGEKVIGEIYEREQNKLKTLFELTDGQKYPQLKSREHFVSCYPFVPYQFDLFQLAIRSLGRQNAFAGHHSSVGERSMLGVFQEVVKQISRHELGELVSFDWIYAGIHTALKGSIQASILTAEKNLDLPLAIRLLKVLFLVKYVREFKPTLRNLCVLMNNRLECNFSELGQHLEAALNQLEDQVFIQRKGSHYEFLTDEEKEIAEQIRKTEVDSYNIVEELEEIIFSQIFKSNKIRYEPIQVDYLYTRKIDDQIFGRENELSIHVVSPFHDEYDHIERIRIRGMGRPELLVVLPPNDRLIQDVTLYKQTEKYISQNVSVRQQESTARILADKTYANQSRYDDMVRNLRQSLGEARMFVADTEVESSRHDANLRVKVGFEYLIVQTYTNLKLLKGIRLTEEDVDLCANGGADNLFGAADWNEAEAEMLAFINRNNKKEIVTDVKALVENFGLRPNGWPLVAVLCVLAKLCGSGKVAARSEKRILERKSLVAALENRKRHADVILEPQIGFAPSQIRQVKNFIRDFFEHPPRASDAKSLGSECAANFHGLYVELHELFVQATSYPFVSVLTEPLDQFQELSRKPFNYFFAEFETTVEKLYKTKETTLDPLRNFMAGSSAKLYTRASSFLATQRLNLADLTDPVIQEFEEILNDPRVYATGRMQEVKGLLEQLEAKVQQQVTSAHAEANRGLEIFKERIVSNPDFVVLTAENMSEVNAVFDRVGREAMRQQQVAYIRHTIQHFEEIIYPALLDKIEKWVRSDAGDMDGDETEAGGRDDLKQDYVPLRQVYVPFGKPYLSEEGEVDQYLASLKKATMEQIEKGRRIQI